MKSWQVSRLDRLAETCLGKMLDRQKNRGVPRPYLRNINVRWGSFDLSNLQQMPFGHDELERYSVQPGDLVVCEGGEPGRCAVWLGPNGMLLQKALHRVRCSSDLLPHFLGYWIRHLADSGRLVEYFSGTTIHHLPGVALARLPVPHPPVDEQQQVVAAIETHFSRLDAAVISLSRAKQNVRGARASVLHAAVEGRLVPTEAALAHAQHREYEPAATLLARILDERRAAWEASDARGTYKLPAAPSMFGLPPLPTGWGWHSIDQTAFQVRNGYSGRPSALGEVPILRISAVRPRVVDRSDQRLLTGSLAEYQASIANPGDLLVTRYNGSRDYVGVMGLLRGEGPIVHPDKLIRVTVAAGAAFAPWLEIAFNVGSSRRFVESRLRTTAGQTGLSGSDVKAVPVPLPPLSEQHRIVAEVDRRLSVLDALDASIDANIARCSRLRQSILQRAFEGRLVPGEPAPAEGQAYGSMPHGTSRAAEVG